MADKIKLRRGLQADLPSLDAGEPGFVLDNGHLYIGDGSANILVNDHGAFLTGALLDAYVSSAGSFDGYLSFFTDSRTIGGDQGLFWDNVNKRLGIGTVSPTHRVTVDGYVVPALDNVYSLGTIDLRWRDAYLGPTSLIIIAKAGAGEAPTDKAFRIQINSNTGNLEILDGDTEVISLSADSEFSISGPLGLLETTAPAPKDGYGKLYVLDDGDLYFKDDGGTETNLISGGVTLEQGADGYIAFFTGPNAIAGDNDLFYNRATGSVSITGGGGLGIGLTPVSGTRLTLPQENDAVTPTLAFGDGDTGFYEATANTLAIAISGSNKWQILGDQFRAAIFNGASILNENATSTNPTLIPNVNNVATGIGAATTDQLSLIAGSVEGLRVTETGGGIEIDAYGDIQVQGTGGVLTGAGSLTKVSYSFLANPNTGLYQPNVGQLGFSVNATQIGVMTTTGFTLNVRLRGVNGDATTPSQSFIGDIDTGMYTPGDDALAFSAGGVEGIRITETTGSIKIDAYGDMQIAGTNHLILPSNFDSAAPSIAFGNGDTGFFEDNTDDTIFVSIAGSEKWFIGPTEMGSEGNGGRLSQLAPSFTVPSLRTFGNKTNTGIGGSSGGQDIVSIIAGGVEGLRVAENSNVATIDAYGALHLHDTLFMVETTAPPSLTGFGKLYVDSSDKDLHFVNSSGTDTNLVTLPQYASVTYTASNTAQSGPHEIFNDGYGGTIVTNISNGITFSSTTGQFTITNAGTYKIDIIVYMLPSGSTATVDTLLLRKNDSVIVWDTGGNVALPSNPTQGLLGINVMLDFIVGDRIKLEVNSNAADTIQTIEGSTFNIMRIA